MEQIIQLIMVLSQFIETFTWVKNIWAAIWATDVCSRDPHPYCLFFHQTQNKCCVCVRACKCVHIKDILKEDFLSQSQHGRSCPDLEDTNSQQAI